MDVYGSKTENNYRCVWTCMYMYTCMDVYVYMYICMDVYGCISKSKVYMEVHEYV